MNLFYTLQIVTAFVCTDNITLGYCTRWIRPEGPRHVEKTSRGWSCAVAERAHGKEHGDAHERSKIYVLKYTECHPPSAVRTAVGCDSSTGSSKALERNVCAFSSLKNEPKPDLAEERYGMNSRAFERPFGIEWISSRTTVEMWTGGLGRGTYIYHQSAEYPPPPGHELSVMVG